MQVHNMGQEDALGMKWKPTLVFFPGKSHGQRSLVGYIHGSQRVRHDLETKQNIYIYIYIYIYINTYIYNSFYLSMYLLMDT